MTRYCLGFAFCVDNKGIPNLVVVEKKRPEAQKGLINGIGGKLDERDWDANLSCLSPTKGMVREFEEETGITTAMDDWRHVGSMSSDTWDAQIFLTTFKDEFASDIQAKLSHHAKKNIADPDFETPFVISCMDLDYWSDKSVDIFPNILTLCLNVLSGQLKYFNLVMPDTR